MAPAEANPFSSPEAAARRDAFYSDLIAEATAAEVEQDGAFRGLKNALTYITSPKLRSAIEQWVEHAEFKVLTHQGLLVEYASAKSRDVNHMCQLYQGIFKK